MVHEVVHELAVAADGYVLVLHCTGCGHREELGDDDVPLAEVIRRAEVHQAERLVQEDALAHAGLGHVTRLQVDPRAGMVLRCSCGASWPGVAA